MKGRADPSPELGWTRDRAWCAVCRRRVERHELARLRPWPGLPVAIDVGECACGNSITLPAARPADNSRKDCRP